MFTLLCSTLEGQKHLSGTQAMVSPGFWIRPSLMQILSGQG